MNIATLVFTPDGNAHGLYTEIIDLTSLGRLTVKRASRIEFSDEHQCWQVRTVRGRLIFSAPSRQACLDWEQEHFAGNHKQPTSKGTRHAA